MKANAPAGFTLYALPGVREFLENLDEEESGKVIALFGYVRREGLPKDRRRCNILGDGVFELKAGQIRLPFFYDPEHRKVIVLTHHFKKQSQNTPPREIRAAIQRRSLTETAREEGTLVYEKG